MTDHTDSISADNQAGSPAAPAPAPAEFHPRHTELVFRDYNPHRGTVTHNRCPLDSIVNWLYSESCRYCGDIYELDRRIEALSECRTLADAELALSRVQDLIGDSHDWSLFGADYNRGE